MIIPEKTIEKWKTLAINGDQTKMANGDNTLRTYITNALNGKDCTEETFILIRDFYKERQKLLKTAEYED
jgi:hypothetical protein